MSIIKGIFEGIEEIDRILSDIKYYEEYLERCKEQNEEPLTKSEWKKTFPISSNIYDDSSGYTQEELNNIAIYGTSKKLKTVGEELEEEYGIKDKTKHNWTGLKDELQLKYKLQGIKEGNEYRERVERYHKNKSE